MKKHLLKKFFLTVIIAFVSIMIISCVKQEKQEQRNASQQSSPKIKAGFIYVGPVGDFGWTSAHDAGRKHVSSKFPWLETIFIESVKEGDAPRVIDRLINEEKCDIVFSTSFGYMDATIEAAKKYPDKIFMHCSGYKREKNAGTYFADMYQSYYLNGLMAGALTKSNKLGYVAPHPIPEVFRHINAFALGIKEVNPNAKLHVKWLYSWYDPAKAREAAETLIAEGCDALDFEEDSPATIEVCKEYTNKGKMIYSFSHYNPMYKFGENCVVSGQLVDWSKMYEYILTKVYTGTWTNEDIFWLIKEKAVQLGCDFETMINPKFESNLKSITINDPVIGKTSVYDLVMTRLGQLSEPTLTFDPFTGPIKDQNGTLKLKSGERVNYKSLLSMDWFVDNIVGKTK
jgi:basic membrane protein A and related proteins